MNRCGPLGLRVSSAVALLTLLTACSDDGVAGGEGAGSEDSGGAEAAVVVLEVAAGARNTCARLESGAVECWGADGAGQLGDGAPLADSDYPVAVTGLGEVRELTLGAGHACALSEDDQLSCWGYDFSGQLGDGPERVDQPSPVAVGALAGGVEAVAAGSLTTCAATEGGVRCWGNDWFDQVGDGEAFDNPSEPAPVSGIAGSVEAVATGPRFSCALLDSGAVQCWGQCWLGGLGTGVDECDPVTEADAPAMLSGPATAISVGGSHACALLESGAVECWGDNSRGQLGTGDYEGRAVPTEVGLWRPATSVVAGQDYSCALLDDGVVWCWGDNDEGQLGSGELGGSRPVAARVEQLDAPVTAIAAGGWHACALIEDGTLHCWGANHHGQLGDGSPHTSRGTPAQVLGLGEGLTGSVEAQEVDGCAAPDPGLGISAEVGAPVAHWSTLDDEGEVFELCELGGRPILLDISASWCPPCQGTANWMAEATDIEAFMPWVPLKRVVAEESFVWVTILTEGPEVDVAATVADAAAWESNYRNPNIPVVIDPDGEMVPGQFWISGLPGFALIDPSFHWDYIDGGATNLAAEKFGP